MRKAIVITSVILLFAAVYSSAFTVDRTEYVYRTHFGRHVETYDGQSDGGLHWKWPWPVESVIRVDRRLQYFDLPETELLTREKSRDAAAILAANAFGSVNPVVPQGIVLNAPDFEALLDWIEKHQSDQSGIAASSIDRNITVSAYVCWRIADTGAVDTFLRRISTPDLARKILTDQIRAELASIMGQKRLDDLISTDRDKVDRTMEEIHTQLVDGMTERARGYGIEIVDIRLRRTSHPMEVRKTIFEKIKSERFTKAQRERDEGDAISRMIRKRADAEAERIRNDAVQAKRLREEEGKVEAGEIRLKAYSQDRDFAEKLIQMQKMLEALNPNKSVILVSMRDLFWKQLRGPNGNGKGSASAQ